MTDHARWRCRLAPAAAIFVASIALTGCAGIQSALDPKGPEAERLASLIWFFTIVCFVVWLLVMIALAIAVWCRPRPEARTGDPLALEPVRERRVTVIISGLVAATAIVLVVFTVLSYFATRSIASPADDALPIEITGYQWWWDIKYQDAQPSRVFETANEIHVPIGRPIKLTLKSNDVIHSFWVPNVSGKQDLIPGQVNQLVFTVSEPGIYRGQCAEYCGLQHAFMALVFVAEPPEAFERWRNGQVASAAQPHDPTGLKGERLFESRGCMLCHTIRGTQAGGRQGPDLTHVGSRATLAAGTLRNSPANLEAWIADPQTIKPGDKMPLVPLAADDLNAVAAYLEALR